MKNSMKLSMKLVRKIYRDSDGNEWIIERHKLPKKRGEYIFWTAECGNKSYRSHNQKSLLLLIDKNNEK